MPSRTVLLLCLLASSWLVGCEAPSPSGPDPAGPRDTLTVMTYNIFHDAGDPTRGVPPWLQRRDAVVGLIRSEAPDVLGLQEAKVWQVDWLLSELPEYAAVARGPYADAGVEDAETTAILFLRERFALRESGHFWYSESPDLPGSYGSETFGGMASPRMATWVRLGAQDTPQTLGFYVFNTHFIADGRASDAGLARFKSAELLVARITERAQRDAPFLVVGDLNTGPGSWPLRYLMGSRCESGDPCPEPRGDPRMIDTWDARHPGDPRSGSRCDAVTGEEGSRVDHILISDTLPEERSRPDILRADIVPGVGGCPSDHRPVVVRIAITVPLAGP